MSTELKAPNPNMSVANMLDRGTVLDFMKALSIYAFRCGELHYLYDYTYRDGTFTTVTYSKVSVNRQAVFWISLHTNIDRYGSASGWDRGYARAHELGHMFRAKTGINDADKLDLSGYEEMTTSVDTEAVGWALEILRPYWPEKERVEDIKCYVSGQATGVVSFTMPVTGSNKSVITEEEAIQRSKTMALDHSKRGYWSGKTTFDLDVNTFSISRSRVEQWPRPGEPV